MPPRKTTAPAPTPTTSSFSVRKERMTNPPPVIPAKSSTHSQTPSRIPTPRLNLDAVPPLPSPHPEEPHAPLPAEWTSIDPAAWGAASSLENAPRPTDSDGDAPMGDVPIASLIANAVAAMNTSTAHEATTSKPVSRRRTPPSPVFIAEPVVTKDHATGNTGATHSTVTDVFGAVETPKANKSGTTAPIASTSKDAAAKAVQLPPDTTFITPFVPPEHDPFAFMDDKTPQKKQKKAATPSSIIDVDASDVDITGGDDAKAKADAAIAEAKAILETARTTLFPSFRKDLRDYGMVRLIRNESFRAHFSAPPAIRLGEAIRKDRRDVILFLADMIRKGCRYFFATVMDTPHPTTTHAEHFSKGLQLLKRANLVNINPDDFVPHAFPTRSMGNPNALLVDALNWGNVVAVDITNAHDNLAAVLRTVVKVFAPYIDWERDDNKDKWPRYLALAPLPDPPLWVSKPGRPSIAHVPFRQPGEPRNWRVVFAYNHSRISQLEIPNIAGQWGRGTIAMDVAKFCSKCCSWAHNSNQCGWWEVPGIQDRVKRPDNLQELDFQIVEAVDPVTYNPLLREREVKDLPSRHTTPGSEPPPDNLPKPKGNRGRAPATRGKGKAKANPPATGRMVSKDHLPPQHRAK
ncbi:hypothetical protein FRB99_005952 [Tulasnella sp. 403]|nr:hypothetical protein FRB99_005952 [Tulasnella sp. 403]